MAKRKSFQITEGDIDNVISISKKHKPPMVIKLPKSSNAIQRNLRFDDFYGVGVDEVVLHLHQACWQLYSSNLITITSTVGAHRGIKYFVNFLKNKSIEFNRNITLKDIRTNLMREYVHHLVTYPRRDGKGTIAKMTAKGIYGSISTLLTRLSKNGVLPDRWSVLPRGQFNGVSKHAKGQKIFSDSERALVHSTLIKELNRIREGKSRLSQGEQVGVYVLLIAAYTGRNTMPILNMTRDCLRPNPIKEGSYILVTKKNRGWTTHQQSLDGGDTVTPLKTTAVDLILEFLERTKGYAQNAPADLVNNLWLYQGDYRSNFGEIFTLSENSLASCVNSLCNHNELKRDDGSPLRITIGALRKTFVNRIWKLSGGDPLITAKLAGHSVKVSNSNYLAVTPEMEKNHKFCGIALVDSLSTSKSSQRVIEIVPTAVSGCSDPKNGRYAPKNGDYCSEFLSCFRCPNQVISGDDLYRLFSFYWLLIKERKFLGKNRWDKIYAWAIREIDKNISPKFPIELVEKAKVAAEQSPHPMWRDRSILLGSNE